MSDAKKILVVGNATLDLIFQGSIFSERKQGDRLSLAYGGKYVVEKMFHSFGGGGANASVSLARQNLGVTLLARVAKDHFGDLIFKNLQDNGVKTDLIQKDLEDTPMSAILLDSDGQRTIINYRSDSDNLKYEDDLKNNLSEFGWLALFSLPRWPKQEKLKLLADAKSKGLKIFLSLHGDEYRKGYLWVKDYLQYCDILDLNIFEMASLLGKKESDLNPEKENYAKILNLPIVIVTHDKSGSYFYSQTEKFWQDPLEAKRIDTTGAGDAFASGFLGKYIKTNDAKLAMDFAAHNAKAEIEVMGAQTGLLVDKT